MKKIFIGFILFVSAQVSAGDGWTNGKQEIKHIIWKPGYHGFYVKPSTYHDINNCGDKSNLYLIDSSVTEKEVDRLYSMILVAFSSGKKVHLWLSGCQGRFPIFTGLQVNY
jgi:hypothetical protein